MPGPSPAAGMPAPRIVIDVTPAGTSLRTEGPLTIPAVIDILIGQLATLWPRWMQDLMKQGGLVDPKSGLPVAAVPAVTPGTPGQETPGGTGEIADEKIDGPGGENKERVQ